VLGAVIAGSISALLGGTAGQHSGPTGAVAVLLALSVAHFAVFFPNQPEIVLALTLFVVVLSGAIQVLFGLMKWGRVVELLPHSVVSGLLTAIGLMLILEQLPAVLGGENWVRPLEVIMALPTMLHSPVWSELILGLLAGLLMFFWPKYLSGANRWLPAPILVLVSGVFLNWLFATPSMQAMVGLWWGDVRVIGPLNFSMPTLQLPPIEVWQLPYLVQTAFTLAVVGSLVSLLGAVVTEKLTRQMHNPDRELIGQGLG
jgi:SulP family sulfate permease